MNIKRSVKIMLSGGTAGAVNGIFGAGGGMLLVPMLSGNSMLKEDEIFPASVSIIFPICIVSLTATAAQTGLPFDAAWPFLLGSIPGGILAGFLGNKIPVTWMHRILGAFILWGGIRYLW